MNTEFLGIATQFVLTVALSYPLGKYIAKVYKGEKTILDFLKPAETIMFKLSGINPELEMNWKRFLKALLILNLFWFIWGFALLMTQGILPLNPDGNISQSLDLAFNTSISFLVNCNLQHYSGESGLTYFTQLFVVMLFQFVTAATGMAALAGFMKAFGEKTSKTIGNFYKYFILSITRILLPLSLLVGIILIIQGVPMTFEGKIHISTLEGSHQVISQGPTAAIVAIKQLGTNGGGFFGANSSHPLENPTYISNFVENISILLIPMAMVFAFGFFTGKKKLAFTIFSVMLSAFIIVTSISVYQEYSGNPKLESMSISQSHGAMEGKEVRIGTVATAYWGISTTATSNGSVNGMHDSMMPLSNMVQMLNMQVNTWFGGVGVGFLNYFTFIIIAVFISGLMVGRTPEFLGKKIEAKEIKIASFIALLHPFIILAPTAIALYLLLNTSGNNWLGNEGYHGFSEILYEFTSSAANNGSGMEGLNDNNTFWNISTAIILVAGRYIPIIGQVALGGLLAEKQYTSDSKGTLKTDTATFATLTFVIIMIIAALAFFPAQVLSTIAEHLSL
ncbi:MAG: potassium-transporting ATPase subunit KdpA [Muribaculaceae bacterium]|nr:potassium-transporting ATPase subunit KdpA [Muribaculaceae bacterium]